MFLYRVFGDFALVNVDIQEHKAAFKHLISRMGNSVNFLKKMHSHYQKSEDLLVMAHIHNYYLFLNTNIFLDLRSVYLNSKSHLAVLYFGVDNDVADGVKLINHIMYDWSIDIPRLSIVITKPNFRSLDEQFDLKIVLLDHIHHPLFIIIDNYDGLF